MSYKDLDFNERRDAAATAKKALLDKFKARPAADDPSVVARQDERRRILEAREIREREREVARQERLARESVESADRERIAEEERKAAEEAARLEAERLEEEERERLSLELATDAEKKAKRDARYAARKARSGKRW